MLSHFRSSHSLFTQSRFASHQNLSLISSKKLISFSKFSSLPQHSQFSSSSRRFSEPAQKENAKNAMENINTRLTFKFLRSAKIVVEPIVSLMRRLFLKMVGFVVWRIILYCSIVGLILWYFFGTNGLTVATKVAWTFMVALLNTKQ